MSKENRVSDADWLDEAARYFEKRPTGGEDMAFWANVSNAERCRSIAQSIRSKPVAGVKPPIDSPTVVIGYTNWRGQYGEREIVPMRPWFGSTEWHPEAQWLLKAWDVEKDADRDFAIKDIGFKSPQPEAVITDEMVQKGAEGLRKMYHGGEDEPFHLMAKAVLTAALKEAGNG